MKTSGFTLNFSQIWKSEKRWKAKEKNENRRAFELVVRKLEGRNEWRIFLPQKKYLGSSFLWRVSKGILNKNHSKTRMAFYSSWACLLKGKIDDKRYDIKFSVVPERNPLYSWIPWNPFSPSRIKTCEFLLASWKYWIIVTTLHLAARSRMSPLGPGYPVPKKPDLLLKLSSVLEHSTWPVLLATTPGPNCVNDTVIPLLRITHRE